MSSPKPSGFLRSRFLEDVRKTAAAIGAPFSESVTEKALDIYADQFSDGAISLRTTNRQNPGLDYRVMMTRKTDILGLAEKGGLIERGDVLSSLVTSWCSLYGGTPELSCDFEASKGLAKLWIWLGAVRPLDEILMIPELPDSIRRHGPLFHSLGLTIIQHIAVDYKQRSVNFYFDFKGETTPDRAAALTKLAKAEPPDHTLLKQMNEHLTPAGHPFAVTMTLDGVIKRVCFYAVANVTAQEIDPAISAFWSAAPCYNEKADFNALGWSFGGEPYVKAVRGYCGNILILGAYWSVVPEELE